MTAITERVSREDWDRRLAAVSRFMLLGNMRIVSEQIGVSYDTLMDWRKTEWWPELVDQVKRQRKSKTNDSITKVVEQSLDIMQDRLENGDWVHDQKTGQVIRKPVNARDAAAIATALMQRQEAIEASLDKVATNEESKEDQLVKLAQEFQRWAKKTQNKDVIDVEAKEV